MSNLSFISPLFIVADLKTAVSFYTDKLGFEIRFIGPPDDEYWAMIGRDKISIFLKQIAPGINAIPNHTRHEWARWDAYISTDDPDTLYEEYRSKNVSFHESIGVNSDNLRGFEIADADGYILYFGKPNL